MTGETITSDTNFTLKQLYEEIIRSKKEVQSSIAATETRLVLEIHSLKNRIDQLERENFTLREKIESIDRIHRKNNVIIFGLKTPEGKVAPEIICDELHRLLEVELTEADISDCYRLGKTENSPIKVELVSTFKKRTIFSKVKHLRETPVSISNDLTENQRGDFKILRTNLLQARANSSLKSYIRGNRLVVGTREYTVEDLKNNQQEDRPHSAPQTPSAPESLSVSRKSSQNKNSEDTETDWETVEDTKEPSAATAGTPCSTSLGCQKIQGTYKNPKKKSPPKKEPKTGRKLRTGFAKS